MRLEQLQETGILIPLKPPSLPPFAPVVGKLMALLANPDVAYKEVANLISTDVALASHVLRLANSAIFSFRDPVKSVLHAVVLVGLPAVRTIIYTSWVWRVAPVARGNLVRMCWRHNLASAILTEHLWREPEAADCGYAAGLLHGIGQLAMVGKYPDQYGRILDYAGRHGVRLADCEEAVFGVNHVEMGGQILQKWGLPSDLVEVARCHAEPEDSWNPGTRRARISCWVANQLGFQIAAPGCDPEQDSHELSEEAAALAKDTSLLELVAGKINSVESGLAM